MVSRVRLVIVAVLILFAVAALWVRTLVAQGVFTSVPANIALSCRTIPTADGPEEIAFDPKTRLVFVSARDRRRPRDNPGSGDGLYAYNIDKPGAELMRLGDVPSNFHPHGMSLYRDALGKLTLMVINHRAGKSSVVEIFDVAATGEDARLFHRATVEGGLMFSPNDIVAVGTDRFYITNDKGSTSAWGLWLERNLLLGRSKLVYFDGTKLTVAVDGLRSANGVGVSPDGKKIYVAELSGRQIRTYLRDLYFGTLKEPENEMQGIFPLPLGIDNLDVAPDGSLTVSGHTKISAARTFLTHPDKPSPSIVYLVGTKDGFPASSRVIFADDGKRIGASSVGVRIGHRLVIGSPYEKKILDCAL